MKRAKNKQSPRQINPKIEKYRKIRDERRKNNLINAWRCLILNSIAGSLLYLFLSKGLMPINASQIKIKGETNIQPKMIVKASNEELNKPILRINPKRLKLNLMNDLPIKNVLIRRHIIPLQIEIEIEERTPIAFAYRRAANGPEKGMVDAAGYWMPIRIAKLARFDDISIQVNGWMASHTKEISKILQNRDQLGTPLKAITLSPTGELSLETQAFEKVVLGENSFQLQKQIEALHHLSKKLPSNFARREGTTIDITDPSKPELKIPKTET